MRNRFDLFDSNEDGELTSRDLSARSISRIKYLETVEADAHSAPMVSRIEFSNFMQTSGGFSDDGGRRRDRERGV